MRTIKRDMIITALISFFVLSCLIAYHGYTSAYEKKMAEAANSRADTSQYIVAIEDEPETTDFQCTTIDYTIAINVFDRLVEMTKTAGGGTTIVPSLAESWEASEDGCTYIFHLKEGIRFSNGSPLTSSDVLFSFTRLLTHPESANMDIVSVIKGADDLVSGRADRLEGFRIIDDLSFAITLEEPFEAFLACLSMPGASILDEESTIAAAGRFGKDPEHTIGTGPFIFTKWERGKGLLLKANPDCWSGPPKSEGLDLRFNDEPEDISRMFDEGELDVLDLDTVKNTAEYYYRGDIYQSRLLKVQRIAITYIALNESTAPLDDVRVRKALQMSVDRQLLLDSLYSGRGKIENGIFPHGLYGFNPDLPEIPYDQASARELLAQAGLSNGFEIEVSVKASSTQAELDMMRMVSFMWDKIGVKAKIKVISDEEFMRLRKTGKLQCYTAMWTADYNDPDNFIYTFFGNPENTLFRSLCYPDEKTMKRVKNARAITDKKKRIKEYQKLEKKIIQDDAAWIPLFSRMHPYVSSERIEGLNAAWSGSVKQQYRDISIKENQ